MRYPKDGSTPVSLGLPGVGIIQPLPAASANGTLIPNRPSDSQGLLLILGANDSVTLAYAGSPPQAAPAAGNCITLAGSGTADTEFPQWYTVDLGAYVTASSGSPRYRWM